MREPLVYRERFFVFGILVRMIGNQVSGARRTVPSRLTTSPSGHMHRLPGMTSVRLLMSLSVALVLSIELYAQDRLDPASMGTARAAIATVRGLGSVVSNPGALDLRALDNVTIDDRFVGAPYTFGATIGSTYFGGDRFREIFGQQRSGLSNAQRQRLGELLQDEKLFANGGINLLTLRYRTDGNGTFGLQYGHRLVARVNFPEDFRTLLSTGNVASDYAFVNRGVGATWTTQLGVSWGTRLGSETRAGWLPSAGVGATLKLVQGVAHFEITDNSMLTVEQVESGGSAGYMVRGGYTFRSATPNNFDQEGAVGAFQSALFPGTSGFGVGADLGVSGVLYRASGGGIGNGGARDAIFYGIVLQDVGTVSWSTNAFERRLHNVRDTLSTASLTNDQFRRYEGKLIRVPDFSTPLASVLRAGLGFDIGALYGDNVALRVNVEGEAPLNDVPGNPENPRIAIGADYSPSATVALRTGVSVGGTSGFGVGLGIGVRPLDWLSIDVGTSEIESIATGERVDLAFRLTAGFP